MVGIFRVRVCLFHLSTSVNRQMFNPFNPTDPFLIRVNPCNPCPSVVNSFSYPFESVKSVTIRG
ncbi:protein of unknown function [Candidatus Promineifilum breve]|uniref:Uncharacterized protein n=1 Tax=Candidatus Promineifilum breve TaxID=1806508 RepID=A0A160T9B5_9CHLR|nr:protein of unknown function [Candidatus Promineifilum breve]